MRLSEVFLVGFRAASHAAMIQSELRREGKLTIDHKPDGSVVTNADHDSEEAILEIIRERFPTDGYLCEEGHESKGTSGRTWIVDPLDGTRYYAAGFDGYGPLIALKDRNGLQLGLILHDASRTIWWAERGAGAFRWAPYTTLRGDEPMRIPPGPDIRLANARLGLASLKRLRRSNVSLDRFLADVGSTYQIETFGGFMAVAEGKIDVFVGVTMKEWDVAANAIILREAGGAVVQRSQIGDGVLMIGARTEALAIETRDALFDAGLWRGPED